MFKRRGRHSFGNLKRPCFNFAADRRSETALSFGNLTVSKGDRDISVGRPRDERRLFKPSQCKPH